MHRPEDRIACYVQAGTKTRRIGQGDVPRALAAGDRLWVDINAPTEEDIAWLGNTFGFHPLALSDVGNDRTRSKQEPYEDGILFIVFKALNFNKGHDRLETINLNIFLSTQFVVTVHRLPVRGVRQCRERMERSGDLLNHSTGFLAYTLMDHAVDYYLDLLNEIDAAIERVETALFDGSGDPLRGPARRSELVVPRIFALKKRVTHLRRSLRPKRDLLNELIHTNYPHFDDVCRTHLRDVLDHVAYINDTLESMPDNLTMLLESHLTQVANRQNEIMKILSVVSTVMLPLTLLASIYGMNFAHLPFAESPWGFWGFVILMVAVGATTLALLRRRGFL